MSSDEERTEQEQERELEQTPSTSTTAEETPVTLPEQQESENPVRESSDAWRQERLELARPDETQRGELAQNGGARPGEGALQDDPRDIRGLGAEVEDEVIVDLARLRAWKKRIFLGGPSSADWEEFDRIIAGRE